MNDERLEALVRWYRQLAAQKSEIEAQMAQVTAEIGDATDIGWSIIVDDVPATKRKPKREFSMALAVALIPEDEREGYRGIMYDPKAVRQRVEDAGLLESCMVDVPGRLPSVVLR